MYNPYALPQTYLPNQQASQQTSVIWVQGEAGAKAYPVAPGNQVLLMDSETNKFFIKSADYSGMPQPLRVFEYSEVVNKPAIEADVKNQNDYVSREEFEGFKIKLDEMKKALDELMS